MFWIDPYKIEISIAKKVLINNPKIDSCNVTSECCIRISKFSISALIIFDGLGLKI